MPDFDLFTDLYYKWSDLVFECHVPLLLSSIPVDVGT